MFTIAPASKQAQLLLKVTGEIDLTSIDQFRHQLDQLVRAGHSRIALDASGIRYIYSEGLEAILSVNQKLQAQGGYLRLVNPSPRVSRLLQITRLDELVAADA